MKTLVSNIHCSSSWRSLLSVLSAGLLLAGCAASPVSEIRQSPTATDIGSWQFTGRVSLTQAEQGWHAGLSWQQQADRFQLKISGPLGQEAFRLTGNAAGVLLEDADGKKIRAADAEALLLQTTGWELPVTGLRYWVRGLPVPRVYASERRDLQGRLQALEQSGWAISYVRYHVLEGVSWPAKLRLARDDVMVKLVIDEWQPGVVTGFEP